MQALNAFLSQIRRDAESFGTDGDATKESEPIEFLEDPQLAGAMREGTKIVHKAAENSIFTK